MKTISTLLAVLLAITTYAQDESRWGVGIGYHSSVANLAVEGVENEHTMIKLGVTRQIRANENSSVFWGLEVSRVSVDIPAHQPELFGPTVPASTASPTMLTFLLGGKRQKFDGLFYLTGALLLEYDFGAPESSAYAVQNGLGIMVGLGKDIHITEDYVISIDPTLRMRSGVDFRSVESTSLFGEGNNHLLLDAGVMVTFAYKFF